MLLRFRNSRSVAVIDLGFGDAGKGLCTDYLCATAAESPQARIVNVRFNGGAQAGHTVVLADGRAHTFSQIGAGSFRPGVRTVLAHPVLVHPGALLREAALLEKKGVGGILRRLHIDGRCRVITPFHQAYGRLLEWQRGAQAHGSCGVGIGACVEDWISEPGACLRYEDFSDNDSVRRKARQAQSRLLGRLGDLRWLHDLPPTAREAASFELQLLEDSTVTERWLAQCAPLAASVSANSAEAIGALLADASHIVWEGAQGILLDQDVGFHPHTTWSDVRPQAAMHVARDYGMRDDFTTIAVLRSYMVRHGAGPLPTEDVALSPLLEPHNSDDGWQGKFRRGHLDFVLLRYALRACAGTVDALMLTHADALARASLRTCDSYADVNDEPALLTMPSLAERVAQTQALMRARPQYSSAPVRDEGVLLSTVEAKLQLPVWRSSTGPTATHVAPRLTAQDGPTTH